jgi:hypothetical protein
MTRNRLAWILGFFAVAACGESSQGPATGGSPVGSTGSGGASTGSMASGGAGNPTGSAGSTTGPSTGSNAGGSGGANSTGSGGAGTGGTPDSGATGGSKIADGGPDGLAPGGCSDQGPDPTPKAPFMKSDPIDTKFPFSTHWMGMFADDPTRAHCISMTSLTDIDNDGDLDFADGQRDVACSGATNPGAPLIWWEYCKADHWVRHTVGTGYKSAASGGAADFDGDGWIDLVAGDSWFKNPGLTVRSTAPWQRYGTGAPGTTEEITMGDLSGDGKLDALYVVSTIDPQWWTPGADPTKPWTLTRLSTYRQQQGGAIGDLDGDGKNDALVGDHWWYKNPGGAGTWTPMPIPASPFAQGAPAEGSAPLTMMGDIDGDGDLDIALSTHWGYNVAWFENGDGKGTMWTTHMIAGPGGAFPARTSVLHDTIAADFDNDGDLDVLTAENLGSMWIFENLNGKGTMWAEHKVATGPGHEARAADVDCDGDLDIVGKSWSDPNDGRAGSSEIAALLGHHVYYKNELVERGGKAVFERPKGEVWNVPNKGRCK